MKVIGVVGMPASGKGEFSQIAREMGVPVVVMGDVIRKHVEEAGLSPTDRHLGEMSKHLRKAIGMDAIARVTIPIIENQSSGIVVVDGIRGDYEVETFRRHFPEFILIGIESSFENRLKRLAARGRSDDTLSRDELRERDRRELGWGLGRALAQADCTLHNDGSLEAFRIHVRDLLFRLVRGGV
ncbi:MAG: flagellar hook-basal body complex protein FliE [Methanomicrobiaceae archaeon]|uniref:Putative dephospho-coa kinase archaeal n=1 Tax=hydrocarbon metagenome TaxID=938273 RepID=A0A0W8FGR1_9ZZZZ|nr:flagellar hook-basal body complex protein FliE [Methanomicrobiaceae archaeon]MDD5419015.1 AAA family ATPase [Methanomicrobiaceae archaeon]